ncbi:MAG TPA: bifunctional phosphoribosyl-AMP cyclohydrolase/phosphoribosyl-ATP diphosphatase HisIE [Polyangiaceae bacterium]|nr:bifunctional phosphoribosyl-AMP cyclohydrolase/phosphoribosyl-ATP diphosphatase HisIE [Polyangiaceae bacterium]
MTLSVDALRFNDQGLIPAIVQDHLTGEVRMMAWMDRAAVEQTLRTGKATFFSRSRNRTWVKGEESGNVLWVKGLAADCDADTLLVSCEPAGPSCHTGRDNCFFEPVLPSPAASESDEAPGAAVTPGADGVSVKPLVDRLEALLEARKTSTGEKSYTRSLFDGGAAKIGSKIREEAGEVSDAIASETDERVASEAADVLYHLLVGLRHRDVDFRAVLAVLNERFGTSGHTEKASRAPR